MNKAYDSVVSRKQSTATRDWRKGMSDNVAWALLIYTALQIFVTVHAMRDAVSGSLTMLPYMALALLVIAIIPACRMFERRWSSLSDEEGADPALSGAYRRDQMMLWLLAIGLPFVMTALLKAGVNFF